MALCRNVLQENDILWELHADTRFDVSDYSDNGSLESDSDVPTISTPIFSSHLSRQFSQQCEISLDIARQKRESMRH